MQVGRALVISEIDFFQLTYGAQQFGAVFMTEPPEDLVPSQISVRVRRLLFAWIFIENVQVAVHKAHSHGAVLFQNVRILAAGEIFL